MAFWETRIVGRKNVALGGMWVPTLVREWAADEVRFNETRGI